MHPLLFSLSTLLASFLPDYVREGWKGQDERLAVEGFRQVWESFFLIDDVAEKIGRTVTTTSRLANILRASGCKLPPKMSRAERNFEEIWNMARSPQEAALMLRRSLASTITRAAELRGKGFELKRYDRTRDEEEAIEVVEMWNRGDMTAEQIAQELHLTKPQVYATVVAARKAGQRARSKKGGGSGVLPAVFQRAWNGSESVLEVAAKLDLSVKAVREQAAKLQAKGGVIRSLPSGLVASDSIADDFLIAVWNGSESVKDVVLALQIEPEDLKARVAALRRQGIEMRTYRSDADVVSQHDDLFARIWNDAQDVSEVAGSFGVSNTEAVTRASQLRRKGYDLKTMQVGPKTTISSEDFVRLWNESGSASEASWKMDITPEQARSRAYSLRQRGYELKNFSWTRATDEAFIEAWNSSSSVKEVAEKLGMTYDSTTGRARDLRKKYPDRVPPMRTPITAILTDEQFLEIWNASSSAAEAAAQIGVEQAVVSQRATHLRRLGRPAKYMRKPREEGSR